MSEETKNISIERYNNLVAKAHQAIDMTADIKAVITVLSGAMKAFGMNQLKLSEGASIQSILPEIVSKITREFATGTFDTQALANIQEIMPVIEKYKHLYDEQN